MRTVSYLRVSTEKQADRGRSLEDQRRRVLAWAERTGNALLVEPYSDKDSAWSRRGRDGRIRESAESRESFVQMVADFRTLRPEVVVVDTLDRFTRTLREGLNLLEQLRGHGVGLLPLDWDREAPIDVDNDADWSLVVRYFIAAEEENRSRSRRMKRSWEGRRARGAPMRNVAPFGLIREGDRYLPSPDADVIAELDRKYLAGESINEILTWVMVAARGAWTSRNGVRSALLSDDYVRAGVRTPEIAQQIRARMESRRTHHGARRKHEHEFTGVFVCGECLACGFSEQESLMGERLKRDRLTRVLRASVCCQTITVHRRRHKPVSIDLSRVAPIWESFLAEFTFDPAGLEAFAQCDSLAQRTAAAVRQRWQRELSQVDEEEATISLRRANALAFLRDGDPTIIRQARKSLLEIDADENALRLRRDVARSELAALSAPPRDLARLRDAMTRFVETYSTLTIRSRNELNRELCAILGGHPVIRRTGAHRWAPLSVSWPAIDREPTIFRPERRASSATDSDRRARRLAANKCSRCGVRPLSEGISPKTGVPYTTCADCRRRDADGHQRRKGTFVGALA